MGYTTPLIPVVRLHRDRTRLLLIEPQLLVIPHLRNTHSGHPAVDIVNAAIGPAGDLDLFVIDPAYWGDCQPGYAAGWPTYRAPTGVSSNSRAHVRAWLAKYYKGRFFPLTDSSFDRASPACHCHKPSQNGDSLHPTFWSWTRRATTMWRFTTATSRRCGLRSCSMERPPGGRQETRCPIEALSLTPATSPMSRATTH